MLWIVAILLLLCGGHAHAVCGDVEPFNDSTPTNPETIPYTTPVGSNQVLLAGVTMRHSTVTISGVTHAGNAMTAVDTDAFLNPIRTNWFYIVNPTSGTNNIVVQFSLAPLADAIVIVTCSGVDTTNPIRAVQAATGTGTAVSNTVGTVLAGDVVLDMFGTDLATTTPVEGANQTVLSAGNDGVELGWGASQQAGADGGAMSWTTTLSEQWSSQAVSLRPFVGSSFGHLRRRQ